MEKIQTDEDCTIHIHCSRYGLIHRVNCIYSAGIEKGEVECELYKNPSYHKNPDKNQAGTIEKQAQ
jgi:hypothetical protein